MNAEEKMQKMVELIGVVKSMQEETNERATRLEKDVAATTEKVTREMTSLRVELASSSSSSSSSSSLDATVFSEIRDEMKKMREATEAFGRRLDKVEEELEGLRDANAGGGGFEEGAHSKRKNRNRTQQQQHSIDDRRRRLDDMYKKLEELN